MSGHSKWANIKHRKGAQDAKRSKIFTKIIKEITVATKMGGPDQMSNPRLRTAILWAKSENMPGDNIQRAIKKGSGADESSNYEEILYEGFGPGNIAVLVECLTDNRKRTVSSIRTIFNKNHANLGAANSVQYLFDRKGRINIDRDKVNEEKLTEVAIEGGADDIITDNEEYFSILTEFSDLHAVSDFIEKAGIEIHESKPDLVPKSLTVIEDMKTAEQIIKLIDALEDDDDVQKTYTNFEISAEIANELNG